MRWADSLEMWYDILYRKSLTGKALEARREIARQIPHFKRKLHSKTLTANELILIVEIWNGIVLNFDAWRFKDIEVVSVSNDTQSE